MTVIEQINETIRSRPTAGEQLDMAERLLELHSRTAMGEGDIESFERRLALRSLKLGTPLSGSRPPRPQGSTTQEVTAYIKLRIKVLKEKVKIETSRGHNAPDIPNPPTNAPLQGLSISCPGSEWWSDTQKDWETFTVPHIRH
jgi:hypothetical protein